MISILALSDPMKLEDIVRKYSLPVVIYRDEWDNKMKFVLAQFHKNDEMIVVKGHFLYSDSKPNSNAKVICTDCEYMVSLGDYDAYLPEETYEDFPKPLDIVQCLS